MVLKCKKRLNFSLPNLKKKKKAMQIRLYCDAIFKISDSRRSVSLVTRSVGDALGKQPSPALPVGAQTVTRQN